MATSDHKTIQSISKGKQVVPPLPPKKMSSWNVQTFSFATGFSVITPEITGGVGGGAPFP